MLDMAKEKYASRLKEDVGVIPTLCVPSARVGDKSHHLSVEGWALKQSKKKYRFNKKQKAYLKSKFNIGQDTGRKLDADVVAREMRRARGEDGNRLFVVSEFLSVEQVASYFSRLAVKLRNQQVPITEQDVCASVEETNFNEAREKIISSLQLEHPIVVDQYNVCDMVKKNTLKNLKVAMLQIMCQQLDLEMPKTPVRRKAPYIELLEEIVSDCSCGD
jgi:hypothetical protein